MTSTALLESLRQIVGAPHVLTHFGGEFVAGSTARLQDFMAECRNVFDRMQQTGVRSQDGDEAILDAAAYRSQLAGKPVRAAPLSRSATPSATPT